MNWLKRKKTEKLKAQTPKWGIKKDFEVFGEIEHSNFVGVKYIGVDYPDIYNSGSIVWERTSRTAYDGTYKGKKCFNIIIPVQLPVKGSYL